MAKLSTPRLKVILTDPTIPGEDEGREYEVQARNVELCAWDRERARHGWPKGDEAPFLWMTFLAWKSLMRTGQIDACALGEFEVRCLSVTNVDTDEVDPTKPAATSD